MSATAHRTGTTPCEKCGTSLSPREAATHQCVPLPGPVHIGDSGYVWPTWREALVDAHDGVDRAYERRREVFQAAYDAGLTMRDIGGAVGMSAANVNKIIGRQRGKNAAVLLDAPAFQPESDATTVEQRP
jgi:hypothetical protein